jgi:phospholipid/cholesterol/gamma-HCH transport system ATP-binding protein
LTDQTRRVPTGEPPEVVIENMTTIIDDQPVLYRLDLTIPAGETTVLMGPSGVGKSTLIKHIVGLLRPDGGSIRIGDRDVWSASPREWEKIYRDVGAMLGGSFLVTSSTFASLSALDNLIFTLEALGVPLEQRRDRALARLRELDLEEYADHTPSQLAAHATKRLALARALVTDAPFVILDEVEVGLDKNHSDQIIAAVRALRERTGCTLLITTHDLDLAQTLADKLAIMVSGQVVRTGSPKELLDGISSTEDFDQVYQFSRETGPINLGEALRAVDWGDSAPPKQRNDRAMIALGVAAVLVIVALLILLRVHIL